MMTPEEKEIMFALANALYRTNRQLAVFTDPLRSDEWKKEHAMNETVYERANKILKPE